MKIRSLIIILAIILSGLEVQASHLVGGIMQYRYVGRTGPSLSLARYEVTLKIYRDCLNGRADFDDPLTLGVYYDNRTYYQSYDFNLLSKNRVNPPSGGSQCSFQPNVCLEEGIYSRFIDLPINQGFHLFWERCCRNDQTNLRDGVGQSYYCYIPRADQFNNSSPYILGVPSPYICAGDTIMLSNQAIDPNGDSLVYSFDVPWAGGTSSSPIPGLPGTLNLPIPTAGYKPGYSFPQPFGAGGMASINSQNGSTTLKAPQTGFFSIAIVVKEYRKVNGIWVFLSEIRRDVQIIVITCPPNPRPVVNNAQVNYTIEAGDSLCFNISYTDPNNDDVTITASGDILDGTNGYVGPKATFNTATGKGYVSSQFCWKTDCNPTSQARTAPYVFAVTAIDKGCPPKTTITDFSITVTPYVGNTVILGNNRPCERSRNTYTAQSTKGVVFTWTVVNGTIISGQGTKNVVVEWGPTGVGSLTVSDETAKGCKGNPASMNVTIFPVPLVNYSIQGDTTPCEFTSRAYFAPGSLASNFNWIIKGGTLASGANTRNITVNWGPKGQGSVWVVETSTNGCGGDTVKLPVRINFPDLDTLYGPRSVCPNISFVDYRVNYTQGSTYKWFISGGSQVGGGDSSQIQITWGGVGMGRIKVVEINKSGCVSDTLSVDVLINHVLIGFKPIGDTVVCEFTTNRTYEVVYTRRSLYTWTVIGGSITSGGLGPKITVDWGPAGWGSVTCLETSFDSITGIPCTGSPTTLDVRISPVPTKLSIIGNMVVCQSFSAQSYSITGFPGSRFVWALANDTNVLVQGKNATSFIWNRPGLFKISVQEITKDGCKGPVIDTNVLVHPKPTTSAIIGDTVLCFPNLLGKGYSVTGFGNSTYQWWVSNGSIVSATNGNSVLIDFEDKPTATIKVLETSDKGCNGDTIYLSVFIDHPVIKIKAISDELANEQNIEVSWQLINAPRFNSNFEIFRRVAHSNGPFIKVGLVDSSKRFWLHQNQNTDSFAFEYIVRGKDLCKNDVEAPMHRNILLTGSKKASDPYAVRLFWTHYFGWEQGVQQYEVYRKLGGDDSYTLYGTFVNDTFTTYDNGFDSYYQCYRIKATENITGEISWSNEICFGFDPIVWVPNAFSPNGDLLNDAYEIFAASLKTFEITIYDRWGEELFHSTDPKISWDGTYKGQDVQIGSYVYMIKYKGFDNVRKSINGTVTLIR